MRRDHENHNFDAWERLLSSAKHQPQRESPTGSSTPSSGFSDQIIERWRFVRATPLDRLIALANSQLIRSEDARVPLGFSTRVVACWKAMRQEEHYSIWRNWSIAATGCALGLVIVATAISLASEASQDPSQFLPIPGIPLPTPLD